MFKKATLLLSNNALRLYLIVLFALSITTIYQYVLLDKSSLFIPDSLTRMNIARRVSDSLTPGLGQLGGVWLPIPQIFIVPFAAIDFLYSTGLAGAIVNSLLFIIGGFYTYKLLLLLTSNKWAILAGCIVYTTSNNLLFFQSTAMSEPGIISFMSASAYYLARWIQAKNLADLIKAAFFIALTSLVRYEGFAVLGIALLYIFITSVKAKIGNSISLGKFFMFSTLATFGFVLWTLYLTLIFRDPLYWLKVYTHTRSTISTEVISNQKDITGSAIQLAESPDNKQSKPIVDSLLSLNSSIIFMNGLAVYLMGILGFYIVLYLIIFERKKEMTVVIIYLGPLIFLLMNLVKGSVPIVSPLYNAGTIFDKNVLIDQQINIRYGLQLLPFFVFCIGILASQLKKASVILILLVLFQSISPSLNLFLLMPMNARPPEVNVDTELVVWWRDNYTGGKILMSALASDPIIFHIGLPYRSYIFEGTGTYWTESLKNPTQYATWVMFPNAPKPQQVEPFTDRVAYFLQDEPILINNYDLVYTGEYVIYRIKNQPIHPL